MTVRVTNFGLVALPAFPDDTDDTDDTEETDAGRDDDDDDEDNDDDDVDCDDADTRARPAVRPLITMWTRRSSHVLSAKSFFALGVAEINT